MNFCLPSDLVDAAFEFAARAHRSQQRKGSDIPYFVHPAAVAVILARTGFRDEEILAAALLHDVVEDTDQSLDALEKRFPPTVVELVDVLTEQKVREDGSPIPWEERKQTHLERFAGASVPATAIALADKLDNLRAMLRDLRNGTALWERFNAPRERVLWYYRTAVDSLDVNADPRLALMAAECRRVLDRVTRHETVVE